MIYAVHARMAPNPNPSMELDKAAQIMQNIITVNCPLYFYLGCSERERSELSDPVVLRHHIERYVVSAEAGAYRLPLDVRADNQNTVSCTDGFWERRRKPLTELIGINLDIYHRLLFQTLVMINRVTWERDDVPASEVTATYWLHAFVRTESTHAQARAATGDASIEFSGEPIETIAAAACRLTIAFRASIMNRDFPHLSQTMLLLRYISKDKV